MSDPQQNHNRYVPLDRYEKIRHTVNCDGEPTVEVVEKKTITANYSGATSRLEEIRDHFFHCGHAKRDSTKPDIGGICTEEGCGRTSCNSCYGRCQQCSKGLCREHQYFLADTPKNPVVCYHCYTEDVRKQRFSTAIRFVLSPFIEFDESNGR